MVILMFLAVVGRHQYLQWLRSRPFVAMRPEQVAAYQRSVRILVKGDAQFQTQVCNALALLQLRAPDKYAFVKRYVSVIIQGAGDFVDLYTVPAVVTFSNTVHASLPWCAAGIVHEAVHVKIAEDCRRKNGRIIFAEVTGPTAETICNQIEAETLREIGGSEEDVKYVLADQGTSWIHHTLSVSGTSKLTFFLTSTQEIVRTPLEIYDPNLWNEFLELRRPQARK